jgi:cell division protein FtsW
MLLIIGLLAVYTSSYAVGYHDYGDPNFFMKRQLIYAVIGLGALLFFMQMDYNHLRILSIWMLVGALAGLLLVLSPMGTDINGARRWIDVGPISLQPSEFAKLAIVVYISAWLSSRGSQIDKFSLGFVPFVLLVGVVGALVVSEPDMGTTVIIVLVACTLFFLAGAPLSHLALLLGSGAALSYLIVTTRDYQLDRVTSFLRPEADPQGSGYQIIQLLVALGSGGPFGLGWAESRQKHLYLPSAQTDGVFAVLGEELGLIGLMAIMAVFAFFVFRGLKVTLKTRDRFAALLAMGIISWISFQTLINIAGITRTLPLTGVPMPFLSYGGSALISVMAGVGILLSVSKYSSDQAFPEQDSPAQRGDARVRKHRRTRAGPVFKRSGA